VGAYLNLCAIVDTTRVRRRPLELEIRGDSPDLILAIVEKGYGKSRHAAHRADRTLATVPFEPGAEDAAAEDIARKLTLDGMLPPGLD
jgi:hypothetical protein